MVNICESVIKVVRKNKPKRLIGLSQKGTRAGYAVLRMRHRGPKALGREQAPNPTHLQKRNLLTPVRHEVA